MTAEIQEWNKKLKEPFSRLRFEEEGHKYWVEGDTREILSVSSLLKFFYDEFDTKNEAIKWAESRNLPVEMVEDAWLGEGDKANRHGSAVHLVGEQYLDFKFLNKGECPKVIDKQSLGAIQFLEDLPDYLIPVASELQMFSERYWYSGTADIILLNLRNKKLIIADYKTNKALTDPYPKGLLYNVNPKYGLKQDNFGKYTGQFSFYQILLEEAGFEVQARILIHLEEDKPKKKLYKTYPTENITEDLRHWLNLGVHLT